jgi:hypothetical protein
MSNDAFFAGEIVGISGLIIWNIILIIPFGIDGLIIGILCNGIAFFSAHLYQNKILE